MLKPKPKFDADQILTDHVLITLPDSLSRRRQVLAALDCKLTHEHPASTNVRAQLAALDTIEKLQAQLPFKTGGAQ